MIRKSNRSTQYVTKACTIRKVKASAHIVGTFGPFQPATMADHEDIVAHAGFRIIETEGDIFVAPEESVLIRKSVIS